MRSAGWHRTPHRLSGPRVWPETQPATRLAKLFGRPFCQPWLAGSPPHRPTGGEVVVGGAFLAPAAACKTLVWILCPAAAACSDAAEKCRGFLPIIAESRLSAVSLQLLMMMMMMVRRKRRRRRRRRRRRGMIRSWFTFCRSSLRTDCQQSRCTSI